MPKIAINILIVVALAAVVALLPGGGTGANVAVQAISIVFLASFAWIAMLQYREHRVALYSLGDSRRAILYGAVGVAVLTLTASSKLWQTSGGKFAWFALLVAAAYAGGSVIWSARRY
jgi:NADH:ubiquinone oxidoreductase subunit 2 (subunit N)